MLIQYFIRTLTNEDQYPLLVFFVYQGSYHTKPSVFMYILFSCKPPTKYLTFICLFFLSVFCVCVLQLEKEQARLEESNCSAPEFIKVKENLRRTSFTSSGEKEV